ncbi:hypothetical protein J4Q44_G00375950 [Coregonus suidteri]|uniref:Uncharacterized protein n=1 Tax=Coregonus suidteri TaxID=861788 RepID=A0AAN8KMH4_9TELE
MEREERRESGNPRGGYAGRVSQLFIAQEDTSVVRSKEWTVLCEELKLHHGVPIQRICRRRRRPDDMELPDCPWTC